MTKNGRKLLVGVQEIIDYMAVSRPTFYQFIEMGLPARIVNNRWYAHRENIDDFFKGLTRHRVKEIPEDVE